MENNDDPFTLLIEEVSKRNAAIITSDICLSCGLDRECSIPVIINISVKVDSKPYSAACLLLCKECSLKKDWNLLIRNLKRFTMEGQCTKYDPS